MRKHIPLVLLAGIMLAALYWQYQRWEEDGRRIEEVTQNAKDVEALSGIRGLHALPYEVMEIVKRRGFGYSPMRGMSFLKWSIHNCSIPGVEFVVREGKLGPEKNPEGKLESPIQMLLDGPRCENRFMMMKALLDAGVDPNLLPGTRGNGLHLAMQRNPDVNLVGVLLMGGANPLQEDDTGKVPLELANGVTDANVVIFLLRSDAAEIKYKRAVYDRLMEIGAFKLDERLLFHALSHGGAVHSATKKTLVTWAEANGKSGLVYALQSAKIATR